MLITDDGIGRGAASDAIGSETYDGRGSSYQWYLNGSDGTVSSGSGHGCGIWDSDGRGIWRIGNFECLDCFNGKGKYC